MLKKREIFLLVISICISWIFVSGMLLVNYFQQIEEITDNIVKNYFISVSPVLAADSSITADASTNLGGFNNVSGGINFWGLAGAQTKFINEVGPGIYRFKAKLHRVVKNGASYANFPWQGDDLAEQEMATLISNCNTIRASGGEVMLQIYGIPEWLSVSNDDRVITNNLPNYAKYPPSDYNEWKNLVVATVQDLFNRGLTGIDYYEIYGEPNAGSTWYLQNMPCLVGGEVQYDCELNELGHNTVQIINNFFQLYDYSIQGIKQVDPGAAIGGAAIIPNPAGIWWTSKLAEYIITNNKQLDFFSWHWYGHDQVYSNWLGQLPDPVTRTWVSTRYKNSLLNQGFSDAEAEDIIDDLYYYFNDLKTKGQEAIRRPYTFTSLHLDKLLNDEGLSNADIFLTEWHVNHEAFERRHDTHYSTAFITRGLMDITDSLTKNQNLYSLITYSIFTYDNGYNGLYSLFTQDGLNTPKASFNAFKAFAMLGDNNIRINSISTDNDVYTIATKNQDTISQLTTYYKVANIPDYNQSKNIDINISNIPFSNYNYTIYLIDYTHSNSYYGSGPELEIYEQGSGSGNFYKNLDLDIYGVVLVQLEDASDPAAVCGNASCETSENEANCPADCLASTITNDFFGVYDVHDQRMLHYSYNPSVHFPNHQDSANYLPILKDLGIDYIGMPNLLWFLVEPTAPLNGIHSYDFVDLDSIMVQCYNNGLKAQINALPRSDWATVLRSSDSSAWYGGDSTICCASSPPKNDSTCAIDNPNMGMTCYEAWQEFIYALVERYDGDSDFGCSQPAPDCYKAGDGQYPGFAPNYPMIMYLQIGAEMESNHWVPHGGTAENYNRLLDYSIIGAKGADADIIIGKAGANPGIAFDDYPSQADIEYRLNDLINYNGYSWLDFFGDILDFGGDNYEVFGLQCNGHYTEVDAFSDYADQEMASRGFAKPQICHHADTSLFSSRINIGGTCLEILSPYYDKPADGSCKDDIFNIVFDPDNPLYSQSKSLAMADQARQVTRKMTISLSKGHLFYASQHAWDREYTAPDPFSFSGLVDTEYYRDNGRHSTILLKSRKPLFYSLDIFINKVIGANRNVQTLNLGSNIYAYRFTKNSQSFIIIWHENVNDVDPQTGLIRRNQSTTANLSSYISTPSAKITHIVTALDAGCNPIYPADEIVPTSATPIDETPIFVESTDQPPPCDPKTCFSLNHECGTPDDGCGTTLNCGSCGINATCLFGSCTCNADWGDCDGNNSCECSLTNNECSGGSCVASCQTSGACDGDCPTNCTIADDPDCGCTSSNSCCGLGCSNATDSDCPMVCLPDGCNGICPAGCTIDDDPDCGCTSSNSCCGINCSYPSDNDCPCIQTNCTTLGYECGSYVSCGATLNCGSCGSGEICSSGSCQVISSGGGGATGTEEEEEEVDEEEELENEPTTTLEEEQEPNLKASLTASPNSGTTPLSGVDLTVEISGYTKKVFSYTFYCNRSDAGTNITIPYSARQTNINKNTLTKQDICNYTQAGTYTVKVIVEQGSYRVEARQKIIVQAANDHESGPSIEIPSQCQQAGITDNNACLEYLELPQACRDQGITSKSTCDSYFATPTECIDQGLSGAACNSYLAIPAECRENNILDEAECENYLFKLAMPQQCQDAGATTQEECSQIIFSGSLPQDCKNAGITDREECDTLLAQIAQLTQECQDAGIINIEQCNQYMAENYMPTDCLELNIKDKEQCYYVMRDKYSKLEEVDESCLKLGITSISACQDAMFKKYIPAICAQASIYTKEACNKYIFEQYGNYDNISKTNPPVECKLANINDQQRCSEHIKSIYLPQDCLEENITNSNECETYLIYKYLPLDCQNTLAVFRSECNQLMFSNYATSECQKAGIKDEAECEEYMFNIYIAKVECSNIDDWQCKSAIRNRHLGQLIAKQNKFKELKEKIVPLAGSSIELADIKNELTFAKDILPTQNQSISFRILKTSSQLMLDPAEKLIQTAPIALAIDTDQDGLPDDVEARLNTDPNNPDSDNDGYLDSDEVKSSYNPLGIGALITPISPIDKAIVNNQTLEQPKTRGNISAKLTVNNIKTNKQDDQITGYIISGQAQSSSIITIYIYSDIAIIATAQAGEQGDWQYQLNQILKDGEHEIYIAENNEAGKIIAKSKAFNFFVKQTEAISVKDFLGSQAKQQNLEQYIPNLKNIKDYKIIGALLLVVGGLIIMIFVVRKRRRRPLDL